MKRKQTIKAQGITSVNQCRIEDYRDDSEDSEIDEHDAIRIRNEFEDFEKRVEKYHNYLSNPTKDKKPFVELRNNIDEFMIEEYITSKDIQQIFFKMCKFFYVEDGTLNPDQLMSYLTVDGMLPTSDEVH